MKKLPLFLLFLLLIPGLYSQEPNDTIKTLIITEARIGDARYNYIELTNMGDVAIDLHDFEFGALLPWTKPYLPTADKFIMIGEYIDKYVPSANPILEPGNSFWISVAYDFARERYLADPNLYPAPADLIEQWNADIVMHFYEPPSGPTDSISENYQVMECWNGTDIWYIRHHLENGDSAVIDQVGGGRDDAPSGHSMSYPLDVAGFKEATKYAILVRKFSVKEGNLNFTEGRGRTPEDSEWMAVPLQRNWTTSSEGRKMYWTVGNHGNYQLNETSLTSSTIDIDFTNRILNVPWGIHNKDSVMMQLDYHPGLAWNYKLNTDTVGGANWEAAHTDSSFISARTGDTLIVWACGNELQELRFHINLLSPTDDANVIVPKAAPDYKTGWYGDSHRPVFEVTDSVPGMDTILNIPFATRTDTILKYFEKAPEAKWEFVYADGTARADVRKGDILKVTAKSGAVKEYYMDVKEYIPGHNAELVSITWPDIPPYYKNVFGYTGDTIPGFNPQLRSFKATVPLDVDGIPALAAKSGDMNAKVEVDRAVNLFGTVADQTVTFTSVAEDDTTVLVYSVRLIKERSSDQIQPWIGEPFVSQWVF